MAVELQTTTLLVCFVLISVALKYINKQFLNLNYVLASITFNIYL